MFQGKGVMTTYWLLGEEGETFKVEEREEIEEEEEEEEGDEEEEEGEEEGVMSPSLVTYTVSQHEEREEEEERDEGRKTSRMDKAQRKTSDDKSLSL